MNIFNYKNKSPSLDKNVFVAKGAIVIGNCHIGSDSSVWFNTVLRGDVANIQIGRNTNIQDNSTLHVTDDLDLIVGNNVTVGHGVILHSCCVGDYSLIGMGSVVLDNVEVGEYSLVAAGSLLPPNKKYGSKKLIRGNPAREVRDLSIEEIQSLKSSSLHYVDRKNEYLDPKVVKII
jgi:carbonic anhydrase/acetyltransferase-like protein (isoleucine patch superfamily)